jgi:hypothetical protein
VDRVTVEHPQRTGHPCVATEDQCALKQKFLSVSISAAFRVEFARAVYREKEMSPYPCPCGAIHHRRAARR